MIEVEKNFDLKIGDKERLITGATFIGSREFTDVYYDTPDFKLTLADHWLRERNGRWELKVPVRGVAERGGAMDRYHELENKEDIEKEFKKSFGGVLPEELNKKNIVSFATITTKRETYHKAEFHLDFDEMDFGFTTFEIELMVSREQDIPTAEQKITDFANVHGINPTKGRGKVTEYLFRKNPKHFKALFSAGVVREG